MLKKTRKRENWSINHMEGESKVQGARTRTLIVPCELAAIMVGLSLFQHTALIKWELTSSSLSSGFWDPNLWHAAGLDIACHSHIPTFRSRNKPLLKKRTKQSIVAITLEETTFGCHWNDVENAYLMINKDFISFAAACNIFTVDSQPYEVLLICVSSERSYL